MTLQELQEELFKILCVVDDICRKEDIPYFLDSGTAIGAVREHDFIPWDDDIDIAVLRRDYSRFRDAMKQYLPEHFRFVEPVDYEPAFFDFIPKIINEQVPLREETEEDRFYHNYQNRASVDVIILEAAPASPVLQKWMIFKSKVYYGMGMSKRYKIYDEKYTLVNKIASGVCMFMGKLFTMAQINQMRTRYLASYQSAPAAGWLLRGNSTINYIDVYRADYYDSRVFMDFHGRKFPLPAGYDAVLTKMYGSYMEPPEDKSIYVKHFY